MLDMATFFTTVLIIAYVRKGLIGKKNAVTGTRFRSEISEGIIAIRGKRGIMTMIIIMTIATFCLGFVQMLSKPLVLAIAGERELGILTTVIAMGMMVGSIGISMIKQPKSYSLITQMGYILAFIAAGILADMIFEPLMQGNTELAISIGAVIGDGVGRGNALLIVIAGIGLALVGLVAARLKSVRTLEAKEAAEETVTESFERNMIDFNVDFTNKIDYS
jgi:uncharacterized membrane protein